MKPITPFDRYADQILGPILNALQPDRQLRLLVLLSQLSAPVGQRWIDRKIRATGYIKDDDPKPSSKIPRFIPEAFAWHDHEHDGEPEIRGDCEPYITHESANIYPGDRFHVKVFLGRGGGICESATFDTLEQAKNFAERLLFRADPTVFPDFSLMNDIHADPNGLKNNREPEFKPEQEGRTKAGVLVFGDLDNAKQVHLCQSEQAARALWSALKTTPGCVVIAAPNPLDLDGLLASRKT